MGFGSWEGGVKGGSQSKSGGAEKDRKGGARITAGNSIKK